MIRHKFYGKNYQIKSILGLALSLLNSPILAHAQPDEPVSIKSRPVSQQSERRVKHTSTSSNNSQTSEKLKSYQNTINNWENMSEKEQQHYLDRQTKTIWKSTKREEIFLNSGIKPNKPSKTKILTHPIDYAKEHQEYKATKGKLLKSGRDKLEQSIKFNLEQKKIHQKK